MEYRETITLKDGRTCILRNGTVEDGKAVLDNFILTHEQTDNLLSYPDESDITAEQEAQFLKRRMRNTVGTGMMYDLPFPCITMPVNLIDITFSQRDCL